MNFLDLVVILKIGHLFWIFGFFDGPSSEHQVSSKTSLFSKIFLRPPINHPEKLFQKIPKTTLTKFPCNSALQTIKALSP
jgi:hypothetical protein